MPPLHSSIGTELSVQNASRTRRPRPHVAVQGDHEDHVSTGGAFVVVVVAVVMVVVVVDVVVGEGAEVLVAPEEVDSY